MLEASNHMEGGSPELFVPYLADPLPAMKQTYLFTDRFAKSFLGFVADIDIYGATIELPGVLTHRAVKLHSEYESTNSTCAGYGSYHNSVVI
jgi:hypothetical protein